MFRLIYISFFIAAAASAKLPEPALTLFGGLFQDVEVTGEVKSIIPLSNQHFEIVAIRDGVGVVAKAHVDSSRGDNVVVLRVPRDDGADPRAADYFSRAGEVVRFEVWYWDDTLDDYSAGADPTQTFATIVEGYYTLQSGFGGVIPRSFTVVIPDVEGSIEFSDVPGGDVLQNFEDWSAGWATWPDGADTSADADPDGDGLTNYQEWVLDLDPTQRSAFEFSPPLFLNDTDPDTVSALLGMKPTRVGRTYHIYRLVEDLTVSEDDIPIYSYTPEVDSDDWYQYIDVYENQDSAFWRVIIEINN